MNTKGRITIPTDMDAVPETLDLLKRWGADAIRDCDGTEFPQELKDTGAKIYATYYTTRKDNACLCQEWQVLCGKQHLRTAGHDRLHRRRQLLRSASGYQ